MTQAWAAGVFFRTQFPHAPFENRSGKNPRHRFSMTQALAGIFQQTSLTNRE